MKNLFFIIFFSLSAALVITCGGGSDTADTQSQAPGNGWVSITAPDHNYATYCDNVFLSGQAFISSRYSGCCSGSASDTGVTVTWTNSTTGQTGTAYHSVSTCYLFGTPYLCNHSWSASVLLAFGSNIIRIVASDPSGARGEQTITVQRPGIGFSMVGKTVTTEGRALFPVTLNFSGPVSGSASSDINGNFSITCLPDGVYNVAPSSYLYVFTPSSRTVVVSGSDITGQDFVTEAYFVSGRITSATGIGISADVVNFEKDGAAFAIDLTDSSGNYSLAVPNGTYTLIPKDPWFVTTTFSPVQAAVVVNGADVSGQDFLSIN